MFSTKSLQVDFCVGKIVAVSFAVWNGTVIQSTDFARQTLVPTLSGSTLGTPDHVALCNLHGNNVYVIDNLRMVAMNLQRCQVQFQPKVDHGFHRTVRPDLHPKVVVLSGCWDVPSTPDRS